VGVPKAVYKEGKTADVHALRGAITRAKRVRVFDGNEGETKQAWNPGSGGQEKNSIPKKYPLGVPLRHQKYVKGKGPRAGAKH